MADDKYKTAGRGDVKSMKGLMVGVAGFCLYASPANAQETPQAEEASAPEDIVVTAQRRSERLQDVPIAITALGDKALEARSVTAVDDLRGVVPSLSISGTGGASSGVTISLRGVTGQAVPLGASQATAMYLDGVFLARPEAALFAFDDIERIEVVRGPQGTLYGRNATAGAINIVTRTPGDVLQGGFSVSYGNYNTVTAKANASRPVAENLSIGASGTYETHDGYVYNTLLQQRIGDKKAYTGRIKLRYDDGVTDAMLAGDIASVRGAALYKAMIVGGEYVGLGNPKLIDSNYPDNSSDIDTQGINLTVNHRASDALTLTSASSWRDFDYYNNYDADGGPASLLSSRATSSGTALSQELRASYEGQNWSIIGGVNYYREKGSFAVQVNPPGSEGIPNPSPYATSTLNAYAAFAQADIRLAEHWKLLAGLRYNREERSFSIDYSGALVPGLRMTGSLSDSAFLPMIGINFEPSRTLMLYGKFSKGYQAPGFNVSPGPAGPVNTFGAETLLAYEAGIKSQFWDRRITLNAAGFYYDYRDIQVRSQVGPALIQTTNAATASVKGVEAELTFQPVEALSINAFATYSKAGYKSFCEGFNPTSPLGSDPLCSPGFADRSGNLLSNAPRWSGGANIGLVQPVSDDATIEANLGISFESKVYFTSANELVRHDGWERVDARISAKFRNGFEIFAYGRNLTDKQYVSFGGRFSGTILFGVPSDPRTYGAGIGFKF